MILRHCHDHREPKKVYLELSTLKKAVKIMKIKNPTKFEIEGLKDLAKRCNCTMSELIDAMMAWGVSEEIDKQVTYNRSRS